MYDWFSVKFNNKFVFPDPEPPIINIQQFLLCLILFLLTESSKLIIFYTYFKE